ncbi:MAG: hypothetical protein WBD12_06400, partial [Candidatus Omnitrophota bacterium]
MSEEYYYDYSNLAVGTYVWRDYANNTDSYVNYTDQWTYVVTRADPSCSLTFDKVSPQNYTTSITATCTCTGEGTTVLYRNESDVTSSENGTAIVLAAGNYFYNCTVAESQNYTYYSNSSTFNISKALLVLNLTSRPAWNVTYGTETTVNCSTNTVEVAASLYRNLSYVSAPEIETLGAGSWYYICNATESQNYTAATLNNTLNVSQAISLVNLTLNYTDADIMIEVGTNVDINGTLMVPSSGQIEMYQNGSLINSGESPISNTTLYNETGYYNITVVYAATQNYSSTYETHYITVQDTTKPQVTLNLPIDGYNSSLDWINFTWTVTDNYDENLTCNLTVDGVVNASNVYALNGTDTNYTVSGFNDGVHNWNVSCWDDSLNVNVSGTRSFRIDTTAPVWSGNKTRPSTPATYSYGQAYEFNITWVDSGVGVDSVLFEHNFTGSFVNSSESGSNGNEYYYDYTNLAAGTYVWRSFANDTLDNRNISEQWSYVVTRADPTCTLDVSFSPVSYGTQIYANCSCISTDSTATLYRNGTDVTATENGTLVMLGAGNHYYVCNISQTQNFTASSDADWINVTTTSSLVNLTIEGEDGDVKVESGTVVDFVGELEIPSSGTLYLYENGTQIDTGASPLTNISTYTTPGYYNITVIYNGNQNY